MAATLALSSPAQAQAERFAQDMRNFHQVEQAPRAPSVAPVVLTGIAGGLVGYEIAVATVSWLTGSTIVLWAFGSFGAATGAFVGVIAADQIFNEKARPRRSDVMTAQFQP